MDKKVYSLDAVSEGTCIVKEYIKNSVAYTEIKIRNYTPLGEDEVFKLYRREGEKLVPIGVLEKDRGIFDGIYDRKNIVIVRKNVETDVITPEFFIKEEEIPEPEEEENILSGFKWHRLCGFYSICRYDITDSVLAEIYKTVNRTGFYYMGIKDRGNVRYVAIAVSGNRGNPFGKFEKYAVFADNYYIVCMGIDKTGEYFILKKREK